MADSFEFSLVTTALDLDPETAPTGSVQADVTSRLGRHTRVGVEVKTEGGGVTYEVDPSEFPLSDGATQRVELRASLGEAAVSGVTEASLRAYAVDDPQASFAVSPTIRVSVGGRQAFPWWILALVAAVVAIVVVVVIVLVVDGDDPATTDPTAQPTSEVTSTPSPTDGTSPPGEAPFDFGIQAGDTQVLSGTSSAEDDRLAGTVQSDDIRDFVVTSGGTVLMTGDVQDRVARSAATGTLVFGPRIRDLDDLGSGAVVTALILEGFANVAVDPEFRTDGLGDAGPSSVVRSDDGDRLRFEFDSRPLAPGESSLFLTLFTERTDFGPNGTFRIEVRTADGETVLSDPFPLNTP